MTSEHLRWCHLSKYEYVTLTERNSARKTGPQTFSNVVVPLRGSGNTDGLGPCAAVATGGGAGKRRAVSRAVWVAKLLRLGLLLPRPGL